MSYRVFKNGYVKEIQRRVDDDEEGGEYGEYGSLEDPEMDDEVGGEYGD